MLTTGLVIYLIFIHLLGDFVLQSDAMTVYKSKHFPWLMIHLLAYGTTLLAGFLLGSKIFEYKISFLFCFLTINIVVHSIIEYFTSKLIERCKKKLQLHSLLFYVAIEQFVLISTLFLTFKP